MSNSSKKQAACTRSTQRVADTVPEIVAGIQTAKCVCGWETVVISPEENTTLIIKILEHIQQHGILIPQFIIETH